MDVAETEMSYILKFRLIYKHLSRHNPHVNLQQIPECILPKSRKHVDGKVLYNLAGFYTLIDNIGQDFDEDFMNIWDTDAGCTCEFAFKEFLKACDELEKEWQKIWQAKRVEVQRRENERWEQEKKLYLQELERRRKKEEFQRERLRKIEERKREVDAILNGKKVVSKAEMQERAKEAHSTLSKLLEPRTLWNRLKEFAKKLLS